MRVSSLVTSLALFLAGIAAVNGVIFGFDIRGSPADDGGPPDWLVGSIWTLLFLLLGIAHWLVRRRAGGSRASASIVAFAAFCMAYPLYTAGFSDLRLDLIGNVATALAAVILIRRLWPLSPHAALLVLPVVVWLCFASWTFL